MTDLTEIAQECYFCFVALCLTRRGQVERLTLNRRRSVMGQSAIKTILEDQSTDVSQKVNAIFGEPPLQGR